jgi:pimeloyl-ACP methyl ester carboxylesterase
LGRSHRAAGPKPHSGDAGLFRRGRDDGRWRSLDLPTLARQVAEVADAVGAPHVDLVGHSLGAAIATVLVAERPDLVRTLTLVAGFLTADEPRLKLTFRVVAPPHRGGSGGFHPTPALTTLSDKFFASPPAAPLDIPAREILTGTNWAGLARQVELDLRANPDPTLPRSTPGLRPISRSPRSLPPSSWPSRMGRTRQGVFRPRLPDRSRLGGPAPDCCGAAEIQECPDLCS